MRFRTRPDAFILQELLIIALQGRIQGEWGFYWKEASILQARQLVEASIRILQGEASIIEGNSIDSRTVPIFL